MRASIDFAAVGIDPRRVTIVLEPADRQALSEVALNDLGFDTQSAFLHGTVEIGDLTFLEWRRPATPKQV